MTMPAPLDLAFFKQLRQLGDDVFLSVVARRAARGDRAAVANALEAVSEGGQQELLWARPQKVSIPLLDAKGSISLAELEKMSLLQAVALSLAQDTLSPDTQFAWTHLTSIDGTRRDGAAERTNQWEWRDDRPTLLRMAIELCAEQSRLLRSDGSEHPVGFLFDALVDRVDYRGAFSQFVDEAPIATTFTIDLVSSDSAATLVRRGNLHGASLAVDIVPEESTHLDNLLRWLHAPADKGSAIFEGLLKAAHEDRKLDPHHSTLLASEAEVVDLVCKMIERTPVHAGDILLRVCTGSLQLSQNQKSPPSTVMIEAFLKEHERRHQLDATRPWPFVLPTKSSTEPEYGDRNEQLKGITESHHVFKLAELAVANHCAPAVERLGEHLRRFSYGSSCSSAWTTLNHNVPIAEDQFRRTSQCLFEAGAPKGVIELPSNGRGKKQVSSALHMVAQSGHPQAFDLMVCLLDLGCDPLVSDNQRRKPGSYLDEETRKRWEDVARSARARAAAVDALREEFSATKVSP